MANVYRRDIEKVAQVIAKAEGWEVQPGHGLGSFPMQKMAKPIRQGDKIIRENPRALHFVRTAEKVIEALKPSRGRCIAKDTRP